MKISRFYYNNKTNEHKMEEIERALSAIIFLLIITDFIFEYRQLREKNTFGSSGE